MKIRTDFVTNSSSYCTTEVVIDNPVLLEILHKYKELGLFGNNDPIIGIGRYESVDGQFSEYKYRNLTKTPAFFYFEEQDDEGNNALYLVAWDCPETLDQVLEYIVKIIDDGSKHLDVEVVDQLKIELFERKAEINNAYSHVQWRSSGWYTDGESNSLFTYDPVTGSSFVTKSDESQRITEIGIENSILLEILQKYDRLGLFGEHDPIFGIGGFESTDEHWGDSDPEFSGDPAFYYFEKEGIRDDESLHLAHFCPTDLGTVLEGIITILINGAAYLNESNLHQLMAELRANKEEIDQAYEKVYWVYTQGYSGERLLFDITDGETYSKIEMSDGSWEEVEDQAYDDDAEDE